MGNRGDFAKSQDFHTQLATILSSYLPLEANGMKWDLKYKGKVYRDCHLVFWTVMVRCDTDEAEVLCGKYTCRTEKVAMLCRYCTCPTDQTDNPNPDRDWNPKTVTMIQRLVKRRDTAGLKKLSQQLIDNAWYKLRFNPGNERGIHGACPSEMLHAMLLGLFKYLKECFFEQIGPSSQLARDINGLIKQYGDLFGRQSERDMPKCKFSDGVWKGGKIQAKEYCGVVLLITIILRSTEGRRLLKTRKKHFGQDTYLKDWLLLVELLLEWEAYLCESEMKVADVKRMRRKNRFILHLFKKVARRTKGMGLKLFKFHAVLHMWEDILLYGVPMEHDTGSNESGHKVTKVAAKLTQKNIKTFEKQTAIRLIEFHVIQLAMAELEGYRLWEYYDRPWDEGEANNKEEEADSDAGSAGVKSSDEGVTTGGTKIVVGLDKNGLPRARLLTRDKGAQKVTWNGDLLWFLMSLQTKVEDLIGEVTIVAEHKRHGQIFRGHPRYRQAGKWHDWALIDWGTGYGKLPAEIWCFTVLDEIPNGSNIQHGGVRLQNKTYAVVESSTWIHKATEMGMADLFKPLIKDYEDIDKDGNIIKRRFYLADVDAIASPLCVVADLGSEPRCKYFQVKARSQWAREDLHRFDDMDD